MYYPGSARGGFIVSRILGEYSAVVNKGVEGGVEVYHEETAHCCHIYIARVPIDVREYETVRKCGEESRL